MAVKKITCDFSGFFAMERFSVFGVDPAARDIEFFFRVSHRNIGQHENLM
ncbi:MAG: hypothetical protein JRH08_09520 [Deltaproteobacteria bacterium]|nr:hypothetical protein [Deltaproteobacteria bacterium]